MTQLGRQFDFWGGSVPVGDSESLAPVPDEAHKARLARQQQNRVDVIASMHTREADIDRPAGAGTRMVRSYGVRKADPTVVPKGAHYSEHPEAVRRMVGHPAEIPLQGIAAMQPEVSINRVKELTADPSAGRSPRFPGQLMVDVPLVFRKNGDNIVVDGNHRVVAGIQRNEMFTPARVIEPHDMPRMRALTKKINQRRANRGVTELDRFSRYTSG